MRVYLALSCLKRPFDDAAARRHASLLKVRVVSLIDLVREVL